MHPDRGFDLDTPPPPVNDAALVQDLALHTLFDAMSIGDRFVRGVVHQALVSSLVEPDAILYRQDVLGDFLRHPECLSGMYDLAAEAMERLKKGYFGSYLRDSPGAVLGGSVRALAALVPLLRSLRRLADTYRDQLTSSGLRRFTGMLSEELNEGYLGEVDAHLQALDERRGMTLNATLGEPWTPVHYLVRPPRRSTLRDRIPWGGEASFSFEIHERDDAGFQALKDMRGRGSAEVAMALAQASDHVRGFFEDLRAELAFFVGCVRLHDVLEARGAPTCFPSPAPPEADVLAANGLYDVSLALVMEGVVVGNDLEADGRHLIMITGANQGGKSTFLRSVGLAQLMMQAGMFVGATAFRANTMRGVFTHHRREEDPTMVHGKLDEELVRMSEIADLITPGCLLLCNESFASTNEREGSEIARQVVRAMTDSGVKVVFVTHMYELARALHAERSASARFLRAERRDDGHRTYRLIEGPPIPTSFGEDLYAQIIERKALSEPPDGAEADVE
jgi:hypothetical protein